MIDRRIGRRLFRKYLFLILLPVTITLLVSNAISIYFSYKEIGSGLASLQHEKALTAAFAIEQSLGQIVQRLGDATRPPRDVELQRIQLLTFMRQTPAVSDVVHVYSSDNEKVHVPRDGVLRGYGNTHFAELAIRDAKCDQPWVGTVYFRTSYPNIAVSYPQITVAVRSCGADASVTAAEVELKFIWDFLSRIKIGNKGKVYVVDTGGLLIADPDIGLVLARTYLDELPHVKAATETRDAAQPAMLSRDLAGRGILVTFAPIKLVNWSVFVEQPMSELYEKLNASLARTALHLLAGLVISAVVALALAQHFTGRDKHRREH